MVHDTAVHRTNIMRGFFSCLSRVEIQQCSHQLRKALESGREQKSVKRDQTKKRMTNDKDWSHISLQ